MVSLITTTVAVRALERICADIDWASGDWATHISASLPQVKGLHTARLLAEIGEACCRFPIAESLAYLDCVTPLTRPADKVKNVTFR